MYVLRFFFQFVCATLQNDSQSCHGALYTSPGVSEVHNCATLAVLIHGIQNSPTACDRVLFSNEITCSWVSGMRRVPEQNRKKKSAFEVNNWRVFLSFSWTCLRTDAFGNPPPPPPITYYWTVPLILDHSNLVGKFTSSKIAHTEVSGF